MPTYLVEAFKQSPLVGVLLIAVLVFAKGYVVPASQVTQCVEREATLTKDRDFWQRIALRGAGILERRAQSIVEVAPVDKNPEGPARSVRVKAKPIAPEVKASIEKPSTKTDPASVAERIETANKVLLSAPVQVPAKKP